MHGSMNATRFKYLAHYVAMLVTLYSSINHSIIINTKLPIHDDVDGDDSDSPIIDDLEQ